MRLALVDVQGYDVAVVAVAVDESEIVEEAEVLLCVLQSFVEVEADNIVGYIVATRLYTMWMTRLTLSSSLRRPK